jgi:hypothetical protein
MELAIIILWSHGAHKGTASLWKVLSTNHQFDMCEKITALIYNGLLREHHRISQSNDVE